MALSPLGLRLDPFPGFNFLVVLIDTSSVAAALGTLARFALVGFKECTGLELSLDSDDRREGGRNDAELHFPKQAAAGRITLKRGVSFSDDLWNWHADFAAGRGRRRDGVIVLQDAQLIPLKIWIFKRALPLRWKGPELDAAQSRVALEELELAPETLELVSAGTTVAGTTGVSF